MGLVSHLLSRQAQADGLLVLVVDATIRGPNWALLTHRDSEHLAVVFCGINPGKGSAALGLHLANRSNRFWRTLHRAGFTPHELRPEDGATLLHYRCGLTTVVERLTVSAGELARRYGCCPTPAGATCAFNLEQLVSAYRALYEAYGVPG